MPELTDTMRLKPELRHRARSQPRLRACLDCGRPTIGNRCQDHDARKTSERGSTTERGYGNEHQKLRRTWTELITSGNSACSRCHQPIMPTDSWDLDHTPDRTSYLGPSHAACNRGNR